MEAETQFVQAPPPIQDISFPKSLQDILLLGAVERNSNLAVTNYIDQM